MNPAGLWVGPTPSRVVRAVRSGMVFVVGRWVPVPSALLTRSAGEPYLTVSSALDEWSAFARVEAVTLRRVDLAAAGSVFEVIETLKAVLPFPRWCGSGWDSVDDAFEEILGDWRFPMILVVSGGPTCWARDPHLLLQTVLRLSELSHAFSVAGEQFVVVYAADSWGG